MRCGAFRVEEVGEEVPKVLVIGVVSQRERGRPWLGLREHLIKGEGQHVIYQTF